MKDPHHHCSSATMTGCLYDFTWCEEAISWQGTWSSIYMKWGQAAELGRKSCTSALLIHLIGVTWHLCWQAQQTGQKLNKKARMNYILTIQWTTSAQYMKTSSRLGCINTTAARKLREVIILLYLAHLRLYLQSCVQFGLSQDISELEWV